MNDSSNKVTKATTGRRLVGIILCTLVGMAIGILAVSGDAILPVANSLAPPDSADLAVLIAILGAVHFAKGFSNLRRRRASTSKETTRMPLRRSPRDRGTSFLVYHLVVLYILFFHFDERSWTTESIGLRFDSLYLSLVSGALGYLGLVIILLSIYRVYGSLSAQADNSMVSMAWIWPRNRWQQLAMTIAVCVLNPITEEIVYRGILVHQLALALDSYVLPLALGLMVSLANHAYQGPRAILTHFLWYVVVVGLTFSEAGLLGAIVMHFYGDLAPVVNLRRNLRHYRNRHRRVPKDDVDASEVVEPAVWYGIPRFEATSKQ